MFELHSLGWDESHREHFVSLSDPELRPARVGAVERGRFLLLGEVAPCWARLRGGAIEAPTVGDWVAFRSVGEHRFVEHVLPRRTAFVRRAAGRETRPQLVAANVDRVLIVTAPDGDLSARRLERYLAAVRAGGAEPLVVVNKIDLAGDREALASAVAAAGAPHVFTSTVDPGGVAELERLLAPGETVALTGSSGVGKSSLVNALLGSHRQATGEVRASDRTGTHTTTRRELVPLPGGALLVDTPGMRELGLWEADLGGAFPEVERLARGCRFADCTHRHEPRCAVRAAVERGELAAERLESLLQLESELEATRSRAERRQEAKARGRAMSKAQRALYKARR